MRKPLCLFLLLSIFSMPALAGWSRAGLYGADVRALVVDPRQPDVLFLGTSQGEVYTSRNGGKFWFNPRQGVPFPGYVVDNLIVDGKGRLWAACWGLWGGGVIAVSADGGETWTRRDKGLEDVSIRAIAVDSRDPELLYAGGLTGVFRSSDGGRSWVRISDRENVESLAIDPRDDRRLYVGTWRQAYRTDDGGKSWKHINEGMVLDTDVFSINIDPTNPDSVWLSTCGWVYNSANRGDKWTRFKNGFNNRRIHAVAIDPGDSHSVYAGSVAGLYRTSDGGQGWDLVSNDDLVINAIAVHKARPDRIVIATEGDGIYVSEDKGRTFQRSSYGLRNVRIAGVVPDPLVRGKIYATVLFGGKASGIYQSTDGGDAWERLNETRLPEILCLIVRRDEKPRFLAGTEQGVYLSDDGKEWTRAEPQLLPIRVDKILPYNRTRIFAATSEGVLTSSDGGKSWSRLGESHARTADIALGTIAGKRSLYALSAGGLSVFDGSGWAVVTGGPQKGRTLAIAESAGGEMIVVAGLQGVEAGTVTPDRKWMSVSAPALSYASVLESGDFGRRTVYLTSRDATSLYVASGAEQWKSVPLPSAPLDIAAIARDPFDPARFYIGTGGQGIFIYGGPTAPGGENRYSGGGRK